jgi:hypothetical protein
MRELPHIWANNSSVVICVSPLRLSTTGGDSMNFPPPPPKKFTNHRSRFIRPARPRKNCHSSVRSEPAGGSTRRGAYCA